MCHNTCVQFPLCLPCQIDPNMYEYVLIRMMNSCCHEVVTPKQVLMSLFISIIGIIARTGTEMYHLFFLKS